MRLAARRVARELDRLRHEMRRAVLPIEARTLDEWTARIDQCLLGLALPKRKARPRDPVRAAKKASVKDLDRMCRAIVFERDQHKCRRCGRSEGLLDWAHVLSRRHPKTRHHLLNSLVLCRACHMAFHDRPMEGAAMIRELIGRDRYEKIQMLANGPGRSDNSMTRLYLESEARKLNLSLEG